MVKKIIYVSIACIKNGDKFLMSKRLQGKHMGGYWEFPGGKVELDELPTQAIVREIKEELNITIDDKDCCPIMFMEQDYEEFDVVLFVFLISRWQGQPIANESQDIAWLNLQDIYNINKALPPTIKISNKLKEFLKL